MKIVQDKFDNDICNKKKYKIKYNINLKYWIGISKLIKIFFLFSWILKKKEGHYFPQESQGCDKIIRDFYYHTISS